MSKSGFSLNDKKSEFSLIVEQRSRNTNFRRRNDGPPNNLGHAWYIGKRFCKYNGVFFSTLSAGIESMDFSCVRTHIMSESQTPAQDQRRQSGLSARNSFDPSEVRFSKNYGADQQRLKISDLHFDKFLRPAPFACWQVSRLRNAFAHNFLWKLCNGSKEVEIVESVDDLKS